MYFLKYPNQPHAAPQHEVHIFENQQFSSYKLNLRCVRFNSVNSREIIAFCISFCCFSL